jgi:hypothetical protein
MGVDVRLDETALGGDHPRDHGLDIATGGLDVIE